MPRAAPCTCPPCPEQPLAQYEEVAKQSHLPRNMQLAMSLLHDKIISLDMRKIQRCGKVNDGDGSVETVTCLWKQRPPPFLWRHVNFLWDAPAPAIYGRKVGRRVWNFLQSVLYNKYNITFKGEWKYSEFKMSKMNVCVTSAYTPYPTILPRDTRKCNDNHWFLQCKCCEVWMHVLNSECIRMEW